MGAGFLWISLIYLGLAYAHRLKERMELLEKTKLLINQIKIETEFLQLPAADLINKLSLNSQFSHIDFIISSKEMLEQGADFPDVWQKAIDNSSLSYKIEEKEKLLLFGKSFGTCDIENQITLIKIYENYFDEFYQNAKNKYSKHAKSSALLGTLIGCMLFILLI